MTQRVDESRCHDQAGGIDLLIGGGPAEIADRHDAVTVDRHVGEPTRRSGTVVDGAAANQDIVMRCRARGEQQDGDEEMSGMHGAHGKKNSMATRDGTAQSR